MTGKSKPAQPAGTADPQRLADIVELTLLCALRPVNSKQLLRVLSSQKRTAIEAEQLPGLLEIVEDRWKDKVLELAQTSGGWRLRSRPTLADYVQKIYEQAPPRLSKSALEVLAIVVYRQPVTRGEIERIRGVGTSVNHLDRLADLGWVEVVGQKESPGRPHLYGTTPALLEDLGISSIAQLPELDSLEAASPEIPTE